jgi:hypothetical protein
LDSSNHLDLQEPSIVTSLDRPLSNRQGTRPSLPGTALTSTRTTSLRQPSITRQRNMSLQQQLTNLNLRQSQGPLKRAISLLVELNSNLQDDRLFAKTVRHLNSPSNQRIFHVLSITHPFQCLNRPPPRWPLSGQQINTQIFLGLRQGILFPVVVRTSQHLAAVAVGEDTHGVVAVL